MLEVQNISRRFGGLVALGGVTFSVREGQIKGVIGPNGAGKTTLFNIVSGVLPPSGGSISLRGVSISGLPPYRIARMGVSRTFQNPSPFLNMSVLENVMIGRHYRTRAGWFGAAFRLPVQRREERSISEAAMRTLETIGMADHAGRPVASLPFGRRRMVELARALATDPCLLMLDEPASGLNGRETDDLAAIIQRIRQAGVTVLLVEHDMSLVMEVCDEIVVLDFGKPVAEGIPSAIRNDPRVVAIYLGGEFDGAAG